MTQRTTLYFVDLCSDDVGEVQGMFDENRELLDWWCSNDGNWRSEYFDGFLRKLGYSVEDGDEELSEKLEAIVSGEI